MPKYRVPVEKMQHVRGYVEVTAANSAVATLSVQQKIARGRMQTTAAHWNEPEYEDFTFAVLNQESGQLGELDR